MIGLSGLDEFLANHGRHECDLDDCDGTTCREREADAREQHDIDVADADRDDRAGDRW